MVYGSSGKFASQIDQGAPLDVFFCTDATLAQSLANKVLATSKFVTPYGFGIAFATPAYAPNGKPTEEALRMEGIWDNVAPNLVLEKHRIYHAMCSNRQCPTRPNCLGLDLGAKPSACRVGVWLVPQTLLSPLEQAFIITKCAPQQPLAQAFIAFFAGEPTLAVLMRYGLASAGDTLSAMPKTKAS